MDVLLVPVGGGASLNAAQAAEIISLVEPYIAVPMHYNTGATPAGVAKLDAVDKFLKEMGVARVEPIDMLKVTKGSLPEETQVVVLSPKQ